MSRIYAPAVIINTIYDEFLPTRKLTLRSERLTVDKIISELDANDYILINALPLLIIVLSDTGKYISNTELRNLLERLRDAHSTAENIIVTMEVAIFEKKKNMTDFVSDFNANSHRVKLDIYSYRMFCMNVLKHCLCPKHRIMSSEEIDELLTKDRISINSFPIILKNDPPMVWLNAHSGDLIEITRCSQITGMSLAYRRVA